MRYRQLISRGVVLFVVAMFALIGIFATAFSFAASDDWPLALTFTAVLSALGLVGLVVGLIVWARAGRSVPSYSARLGAFAAASQLGYQADSPALGYPGTLFAQKSESRAKDRLFATSGRFFELDR